MLPLPMTEFRQVTTFRHIDFILNPPSPLQCLYMLGCKPLFLEYPQLKFGPTLALTLIGS
jgi:hypothetical protein